MSRPILAALSYLPAFQLAARHLSFRRAAEELHLTPSAVSQQIRALEDVLGLELFRRMTRALALTPAGVELAALVSEVLDRYQRGAVQILRQHDRRVLRVTTDPFIAHEILIPALHASPFAQDSLDLRIETSSQLADLDREDLDAAIRYGVGPWPGLVGWPLCELVSTIVCAPALGKGRVPRTPAALRRHPLIRLRDQPDPWQIIAESFAISLPRERLVFDSYFSVIRAAEEGLGFAIAVFPTTTKAVLAGRLVTPFPFRVRMRAKFHFLCRREDAEQSPLLALSEWARALFSALPQLPQARGVVTLDEPVYSAKPPSRRPRARKARVVAS
jgi:LysR family glycine cleavage system transcriptional activator